MLFDIGPCSARCSPHRAVGEPAGVTLLVSAVVGGQKLLWSGNLSPDVLAGLSGLLEGEGVAAGCITVMEHHPCKTTTALFMNSGSCQAAVEAERHRDEESELFHEHFWGVAALLMKLVGNQSFSRSSSQDLSETQNVI